MDRCLLLSCVCDILNAVLQRCEAFYILCAILGFVCKVMKKEANFC